MLSFLLDYSFFVFFTLLARYHIHLLTFFFFKSPSASLLEIFFFQSLNTAAPFCLSNLEGIQVPTQGNVSMTDQKIWSYSLNLNRDEQAHRTLSGSSFLNRLKEHYFI